MINYQSSLSPAENSIRAVFGVGKRDRNYRNPVLRMAQSIIESGDQAFADKGPQYLTTLAWSLGGLARTEETCLRALEALLNHMVQMNDIRALNPRELILVANGITMIAGSRQSPIIIDAMNRILTRLDNREDLILSEFTPSMLADTVNILSRLTWKNGLLIPVMQLDQIASMILNDQYNIGSCSIQHLSCILQGLTGTLGRPALPDVPRAINFIARHLVDRLTPMVPTPLPPLLNLLPHLVELIGLANMNHVAPAISRIAELISQDRELLIISEEPSHLANLAHTLVEVLSLPHVPEAVDSIALCVNSEQFNIESLLPAQLATFTTSFMALLQQHGYRENCHGAIARFAAHSARMNPVQENLNTADLRDLTVGFETLARIEANSRGSHDGEEVRTLRTAATFFSNMDRNLRQDMNAFGHQNPELAGARFGLAGRVVENPDAIARYRVIPSGSREQYPEGA